MSTNRIQEFILDYIDIFIKKEFNDSSNLTYHANFDKIEAAVRHIARLTKYEYMNLNADYLITAFSKDCECSVEKFTAGLNAYIDFYDFSLWHTLSMNKVPTPEELIEHILTTNIDAITSYMGKNLNNPPKDFKRMLAASIMDRWEEKWEKKCVFQAKLYDIHNCSSEQSKTFETKDSAMEFARCRIDENPDDYSRYVILIKTPFNDQPVIYTIGGGVTSKYICGDSETEWKVTFYNYTDQEMYSMKCEQPMEKQHLLRNLRDNNGLYYVLSYRSAPDEDFTVQFYKSDRCFNNQDVVTAIEKNVIRTN